MTPLPSILFTAFEPSGDDHAAAVVEELRRRHPALPIHAWGGPGMERAGATIVERTGDDAVMGLPGYQKIREHTRINDRIARWLDANPVTVHVPVDSPAANFPICALAKARGAKVVHLVAPQIWAWGRWRIHKLRRRTDMVLCLLPFEEGFFHKRGVRARFIGHPLYDAPVDSADVGRRGTGFGTGSPRIALMPGSRPGEIEKNTPLLLACFASLRAEYPRLAGIVAATKPAVADRIRAIAADHGGWPEGLDVVCGDTDAVIRWCDLALVASGTVTLQIARQLKPMVVFYKSSPLFYYLLARWLVSTKFFALPNVLAHREVVPEFIPHFGGPDRIVQAARGLIESPELAERQREEFRRLAAMFQGRHAAASAADAIEEVAGLRGQEPTPVPVAHPPPIPRPRPGPAPVAG
ncbi:MAG: lipid-A-disaccharide synthase [Phycisphaerales bacterium]